jgi:diamine N-acetyltransferase
VTGDLNILEASIGDAEDLSALAIKTYVHTFGADFEPDDLAHHLEKTISVSRWREYLAQDRVLMVRIDGRAIAYVQFGPAKNAGEIEIRRLYVDADFQGKGIGTALLERALASPEVVAAPAVMIDVWEKNERARQLYERLGFRHEGGLEPFVLKSGAIDGYDLILVRRSPSA